MVEAAALSEELAQRLGGQLWDAWRAHRRIAPFGKGGAPRSMDEGYAIQDAMIAASGHAPVGWKIGATNAAAQRMLSLDAPLSGRLLEPFCFESPAQIPSADFAIRALEPEFAFRLGHDLPARKEPYAMQEVAEAVASAHPALEIPDTRLRDWESLGAPKFVADNAAAGRFVLGAACLDWRTRNLDAIEARLLIDGKLAAQGRGADVLGHPLRALAWLADHLPTRGASLRAGDLVTTGTCTPIRFAEPGVEVIADFGSFGEARVRFT